MAYFWMFLAGALICNAIPHLTAGLRGEPFPTPFAKPHGVGLSSPVTNFLWGSFNLFAGVALSIWQLPRLELMVGLGMAAVGWLAIGLFAARHFGKVRAGRQG